MATNPTDLFVQESLKRAIKKPEYFQAVPIILSIEMDIPALNAANTLSNQFGLPYRQVIDYMNMVSMVVPSRLLEDLAQIAFIKGIFLDRPMYSFQNMPKIIGVTQDGWVPTSEAIKRVNVDLLHEAGIFGSGQKIAVLDTGVDITNPQIEGGVSKYSTILAQPMGDDENGHGTWCVTCIMGRDYTYPTTDLRCIGVAPKATVSSYKVLGGGIGTGMTSDIMKAMELAVNRGNTVISMSLGSSGAEDEEEDPMVLMINNYFKTNPEVVFVVAAGNSGPEGKTVGIPAVAQHALTVGSWSAIDNGPAYFSSRGPTIQSSRIKPDIMAMGGGRMINGDKPKEYVYSGTAIGSLLDPITDRIVDHATPIHGTSMATPQVAGIIALWKEILGSGLDSDTIKKIFKTYGGQSKNDDMGWGIIDATWVFNKPDTSKKSNLRRNRTNKKSTQGYKTHLF